MAFILNIVGGIIKGGFYLTAVGLAAAGTFTYLTKPTREMLISTIDDQMTSGAKTTYDYLLTKVGSFSAKKAMKIDIKDFVFFRTAEVSFPNSEKIKFVGFIQNWKITG